MAEKNSEDKSSSAASSMPDLAAILAASGDRRTGGRKTWLWTSLIVLGLGAGGYYFLLSGSGPAYRYTTAPVARGDLSVIVTATGSVQPTEQIEVSSELSGTVRSVNVTYNSPVKKGDVLAELDTNKLQTDVQSTKAKLASAKANVLKATAELNAAKTKLDRLTSLVDNRVSSQQDLDAAQYAFDAANAAKQINEASVLAAEADLRLAEVNLGKAKIVSPIDGVVLTRDVDPGATVASSLSAPTLFTIAGDLRQMELQVAVDEADVGEVKVGQKATFTVDAFPERSFPAEIETVRYASETTSNVVTYKAILTVDNQEMLLRPGMTATADINVESVKDTLLIPNAALRYTPPATGAKSSGFSLSRMFRPPRPSGAGATQQKTDIPGDRTLWLLRDGKPVSVQVQTGPTDGRNTVVRSGEIKEGDALITDASLVGK